MVNFSISRIRDWFEMVDNWITDDVFYHVYNFFEGPVFRVLGCFFALLVFVTVIAMTIAKALL